MDRTHGHGTGGPVSFAFADTRRCQMQRFVRPSVMLISWNSVITNLDQRELPT